MRVDLSPELAALIKQGLQRGPYQSAEQFIVEAVRLLHAREEWLAANRAEIAARIEEGYAAAGRGELTDAGQVRARLEKRKQPWLAERRRA